MVGKKHCPEEIVGKLRETEVLLESGYTVSQVCRTLGVTKQTFYRWRSAYGGMQADQARRLKELEQENAQLRKAVANLALDNLVLQKKAKRIV